MTRSTSDLDGRTAAQPGAGRAPIHLAWTDGRHATNARGIRCFPCIHAAKLGKEFLLYLPYNSARSEASEDAEFRCVSCELRMKIEVLDRRSDALTLHAAHILGRQLGAQSRVLTHEGNQAPPLPPRAR